MILFSIDPGNRAGSALFQDRDLTRCDIHPNIKTPAGRAAFLAHCRSLPRPDRVLVELPAIVPSDGFANTAALWQRRGFLVGIVEVVWEGVEVEDVTVPEWQKVHRNSAEPTSEQKSLDVVRRYLNGRAVDLHWRGAKGGIVGDAVSAAAMGVWWHTMKEKR